MKKLLIILLVSAMILLSSCASNSEPSKNNTSLNDDYINAENKSDIIEDNGYFISEFDEAYDQYVTGLVDYMPFNDTKELIEASDTVVIGKVTDISFQVLDINTGMPPTEKTEKHSRWLNTVYDVDVTTTYKNITSDKIQVRTSGGVKGYKVQEQLDLIKEMDVFSDEYIHVLQYMAEIKIGETYLFTLRQSKKDGVFGIMGPQQCVYNLKNPLRKNPSDYYFDPQYPSDYYDKSENENGSPLISAKDIISFFGEDKWESFWNQWTKENPDWEKTLYEPAWEIPIDDENSFVVDNKGNIIRQGAY